MGNKTVGGIGLVTLGAALVGVYLYMGHKAHGEAGNATIDSWLNQMRQK